MNVKNIKVGTPIYIYTQNKEDYAEIILLAFCC